MITPPTPVQKQYLYNANLLENPGFENGILAGWRKVSGTMTIGTGATGGFTGAKTGIVSNTGAGIFASKAFNISGSISGILQVGCTAATSASVYTLVLRDVVNSVDVYTQTIAPYLVYDSTQISFEYPFTSGLGIDKSFEVRIVASGTGSITLDSFYARVKQDSTTYIPALSDWQTLTGITGSWVTNTAYTGKYKRNGDSADIQITATLSGAPTATTLTITLPSFLTIDTTKINSLIGGSNLLGTFTIRDVSGSTTYGGQVGYSTSTVIVFNLDVGNAAGNFGALTQAAPMTFATGDIIDIKIAGVPIVGWTSGFRTSGQIAQNLPGTFSAQKNATQSLTSGVATKVTFQTINSDDQGLWDSVNNRVVIKSAGYYTTNGSLEYATNGTGYRASFLYKNGAAIRYNQINAQGGSFVTVVPLSSDPIYMNVGDYFELFGVQTGGTLNINNSGSTFFGVSKVLDSQTLMNIRKIAYLKDVKTSGTVSGSMTSATWNKRTLNTIEDKFGIVSLSSSVFTLQPGDYDISGYAMTYIGAGTKSRIRQTSGTPATVIIGMSNYSNPASSNSTENVSNSFGGTITVTTPSTFELQSYIAVNGGNTYNGGVVSSTGESEVFSQVKIEKLA